MVGAMQPDQKVTWLEPSVGHGVFLLALADAGVRRENVVAIDLDPEPSHADALAITDRSQDFLSWSQSTQKRFDRIVGNPPHVPLSQSRSGAAGEFPQPSKSPAKSEPSPCKLKYVVSLSVQVAFTFFGKAEASRSYFQPLGITRLD